MFVAALFVVSAAVAGPASDLVAAPQAADTVRVDRFATVRAELDDQHGEVAPVYGVSAKQLVRTWTWQSDASVPDLSASLRSALKSVGCEVDAEGTRLEPDADCMGLSPTDRVTVRVRPGSTGAVATVRLAERRGE